MFEVTPQLAYRSMRRMVGVAGLAATLCSFGCASTDLPADDLAPILPVSESRLETAPPAARDALEEGLQWIASDAPETTVGKNAAIHLAKGDGL